MKVGDYVRNKYGIAQVINIENNNGIEVLVFDKNICFLVNKETGKIKDDKLLNRLAIIEDIDLNKIKSSPNIIDLIEEGDYVNGHRIEYVSINKYDVKVLYYEIPSDYGCEEMLAKEIETIVTKEQFESMEYKI